ncbi:hypothetical protein PHMEG_00013052 [Phytophthora megakarya]|uniref:Uncharacterized protein n=1 Tax=Phytophthora megakarya TaxID=4795 RepID=A0A225W762_9STRA|nr:hypothetical protein PHMEG_00013052 [Phytophthora megakarya]
MKYATVKSTWDLSTREHMKRIKLLMYQWTIEGKASQQDVEDRIRFLEFKNWQEDRYQEEALHQRSYREVVEQVDNQRQRTMTSEQLRLRELCLQPVVPTTQLPKRTVDEAAAVAMILNHEIEVPCVPTFLTHSMTAGELVVFEDMFIALEYPVYANLQPG